MLYLICIGVFLYINLLAQSVPYIVIYQPHVKCGEIINQSHLQSSKAATSTKLQPKYYTPARTMHISVLMDDHELNGMKDFGQYTIAAKNRAEGFSEGQVKRVTIACNAQSNCIRCESEDIPEMDWHAIQVLGAN